MNKEVKNCCPNGWPHHGVCLAGTAAAMAFLLSRSTFRILLGAVILGTIAGGALACDKFKKM